MARLRYPRGASRSARTVNSGGVQHHQDGVGRAAREANVGNAGKPIGFRGWAVHNRPWDGGDHRADKFTAKLTDPLLLAYPMTGRHLERGGESRGSCDVESAGAYVPLLPATVHNRGQPQLATGK